MAEHLLLKWGTLKGWDLAGNEKAQAIAQRFLDIGMSASAAMQRNTPEQDEILCELIDAMNGPITNDWEGKDMTKDEAKAYVRNYRKK